MLWRSLLHAPGSCGKDIAVVPCDVAVATPLSLVLCNLRDKS